MDLEKNSLANSTIMANETFNDPYDNNNGEKNLTIIFFMTFITICSLVSICLMIGIIIFERFGPNSDNSILIDMVSMFFIQKNCKADIKVHF